MKKLEKFFRSIALKLFRGFIVEQDINPSDIDRTVINTVLFVIRHQMGDMLCAMPALMSVKRAFPYARIILVTKSSTRFKELFPGELSPASEVHYYENGFENFVNLAKHLQVRSPDIAIVPSTVVFSGTNHLLAYYSKARIRAGVRSMDYERNSVGYLLNVKNDFQWGVKKVHQVERNLDVIRQLKINPSVTKLALELTAESRKFAEDFVNTHFPERSKKIVGFHPGAGKHSNVWPAEKFAGLAARLSNDMNAYIFISEGPADEKYVSKMKELLETEYNIKDAAVHKGELLNNAAILERLDLFITNDTGIMHIASGLKTPVVALFGKTRAYEWGPLGEGKVAVQSPAGEISSISVEEVHDLCMKL